MAVSGEDVVRQAGGHGSSHARVRDCPAGPWTGRAGFCTGCQGHRDRGAAASVDGGAPAGHPTAVHAAGPAGVSHVGRLLPRERWSAFPVTPTTLVRWHRELPAHRWTRPATGLGGRRLHPETVELVLRMAGRTRDGDTSGAWGSAASSATWCRPPRCGASCAGTGSAPHRAPAAQPGRSSCARRRPARWRATIRRSTDTRPEPGAQLSDWHRRHPGGVDDQFEVRCRVSP
jgi:hypothetical protein